MQGIKVENLSKLYYLGEGQPYSLRELISGFFQRKETSQAQELWALRDVSFQVTEGETLGIIGHNGAGKSTLLKILARITKPSSGTAEIRGRVGCLLEVGTGFHNELSGRENIYLNGAILGMKRIEIEKKFDEIVAFSEIEKFLDTPVKHYSSGMYMRLAFSVAAHLDPEVLIVDEVLAVGDIGFQKKCLNKMREVGASGRTVLFVSHDMQSVARLCNRAIWLKNGGITKDGPASEVIGEYLHEQSKTGAEKSWGNIENSPGNEVTRLRRIRVCNEAGETVSTVDIRRPAGIEMDYDVLRGGKVLVSSFHFYNEQGICIFVSHDLYSEWRNKTRPRGKYVSTVWVPGNFLAEGTVFVTATVVTYQPFEVHFAERDAIAFHVIDNFEGDSMRGDYTGVMPGIVRPRLIWETDIRSEKLKDIRV